MNIKKFRSLGAGLAATAAGLFVVATLGTSVADSYRSQLDGLFGTKSYIVDTDESASRYSKSVSTVAEFAEKAKANAIRQGEEGTVVMKNDNGVLPLASTKKVALFGSASYSPYQASGDLKGGNPDAVNFVQALEAANVQIDQTVKAMYDKILAATIQIPGGWGGTVTVPKNAVNTTIGDMQPYKINEVPGSRLGQADYGDDADWESKVDKTNTIGICTFARPAGENNTYAPGTAVDYDGNPTGKDPLALSADELSVVEAAKDSCSQVIVLLNTGNAMEISAIAKGGAHEVDGIVYIGIPNDYQFTGIVNVLTGKINATGALPDTYAASNESSPAMMNFGGGYYADYNYASTATYGADPRWPGVELTNERQVSSFGSNFTMYSGGYYIVEAEGIFVGYKYYESRYHDVVMGLGNANGNAGVTQGETNWDYSKEVVYPFGHGLSYLDYEQTVKNVNVDVARDGEVTATVAVHNKSEKDGYFLAQLYVQQPYTDYDKENLVEKSAVTFLNSKKVSVRANDTVDVQIKVPTKYLASYDYKNAKTYILDAGDYLFTAAAGSHEAVNNFLAHAGKNTTNGMDKAGRDAVFTWNHGGLDNHTFAISEGGYPVQNVANNADLNYWQPNTVTYLSRNDWQATYPKNYNTVEVKIETSARKDEWVKEIRGQQYVINNTGEEAKNVNGDPNGAKFKTEQIGYDQLSNINDPYWDKLVESITVDQAVGGVIHGGSRTDLYDNIENPIIAQSEGVNGVTGSVDGRDGGYHFNVASQTLLGSSFNEELALEWGKIEGESGLWLGKYTAWGLGLTLRRTPYNCRNYEYVSEDPMLTNRIGYGIVKGTLEFGFLTGPKHMGFNDQEHNRSGLAVFMTEQKMRETDLRGFEGCLSDAKGLAVMIAFNRIGTTNASHHKGMLMDILRGEWGFKGLISTDMATNNKYFCAESMVYAGITQVADFGQNDNTISKTDGHDHTWSYVSVDGVKNDANFVAMARRNLKYQFYAFANSAILNVKTIPVTPAWESALGAIRVTSLTLTIVFGLAFAGLAVVSVIRKED